MALRAACTRPSANLTNFIRFSLSVFMKGASRIECISRKYGGDKAEIYKVHFRKESTESQQGVDFATVKFESLWNQHPRPERNRKLPDSARRNHPLGPVPLGVSGTTQCV